MWLISAWIQLKCSKQQEPWDRVFTRWCQLISHPLQASAGYFRLTTLASLKTVPFLMLFKVEILDNLMFLENNNDDNKNNYITQSLKRIARYLFIAFLQHMQGNHERGYMSKICKLSPWKTCTCDIYTSLNGNQ